MTQDWLKRIESIQIRVKTLPDLRSTVSLPAEFDISERQWAILESQLTASSNRILTRLKRAASQHLANVHRADEAARLNQVLGELELDLAKAFTFYDTYMDVLTQRNTPVLGPLLAGCDVLAWDAMKKDHPALSIIEPPLVFCDRGFGASILRESVPMPDQSPNPMPLIQIPYSRLKEKFNLTSILHEAGHQALVRLNLTPVLPRVFRKSLRQAKAPDALVDLFSMWSGEIGPDFWTFCASGAAQTTSIREILSLPSAHIFRVSWMDPHPPPYLRVLLSFEWCQQLWGKGEWEDWESAWVELYPLERAPIETRQLLNQARKYLPVISHALITTKFRTLNQKTILDFFNTPDLSPSSLRQKSEAFITRSPGWKTNTPCAQLSVFRYIHDHSKIKSNVLDQMMTRWITQLGKQRKAIFV